MLKNDKSALNKVLSLVKNDRKGKCSDGDGDGDGDEQSVLVEAVLPSMTPDQHKAVVTITSVGYTIDG